MVLPSPEEKYLPINQHTKRRHPGMRIGLQKMRMQYSDHLRPFYGVLGFGPESDFLDGTIYRFPFRKPRCGCGLVPDDLIINAESAQVLMEDYFTEAKRSLLFMTRITTIEFRIQNANTLEWKVTTTRSPTEGIILGGTVEQVFIESRQLSPSLSIVNDEWRLALREIPDILIPKRLQVTRKEHKLKALCGIAALVSHRYTGSEFDGRLFSHPPFSWSSKLPVHVQASFIGSSRHPIPIVDVIHHTGSEWNLWILKHGVVDLYLDFLQYLADGFGELAFKFWPPHEGVPGSISDTLGRDFWRKVPESELKLFAVGEQKSAIDLRFVGVDQNWTRKTLSITEVIFDFLEPKYSDILRTLLNRLGVKNIVNPTEVISKALPQYLEGVTQIGPPYVSSLLRGNPTVDVLHEIWAADGYSFHRLGPFLEFMTKKPGPNPDILTDCRIVPLANLTLGTLGNPDIPGISNYYISQRGALGLFDYAPGLMVHTDLPQAMVDILLKLGLNVSILPFSDLPKLFENVVESDKISITFHYFLLKFWVAVRYEYEGKSKYDKTILSNLPVYSATVNGRLQAISPDEFESLPAIISPDDEEESAMCSTLTALYLVDGRTVSTVMHKAEQLTNPVGLMRFITSLEKMAKLKHKTAEAFFPLLLELEHITASNSTLITKQNILTCEVGFKRTRQKSCVKTSFGEPSLCYVDPEVSSLMAYDEWKVG